MLAVPQRAAYLQLRIQGARRLVLVADDEAGLRQVVAGVLAAMDLVPLLADDGVAEIAAAEAHQSELRGAILDIAMPGIDGIDAAHAIQRLAPEPAIILMSGVLPANFAARTVELRLAGVLSKPFPLAALRTLIQHKIDGGPARQAY
jgi:CheY-like chemotaxis protein